MNKDVTSSQDKKDIQSKKSWAKPEIIDIDVAKATLGATIGPSATDGGSFKNDYNS